MKKPVTIIGIALLAMVGKSQDITNSVISFAQLSASNRMIEFAVYPTYAPQIVVNGKKDVFGVGAALLTPATVIDAFTNNVLAQHTFVGLRLDYLAHQAFASTVAVGMKGDMQIFGHNFTGFAHSGVNIPISGFGNNNANLGAMVGGGVYTSLWQFSSHGGLGIQASAEKWTQFPGYEFLGGPVINLNW